MDTHCIEENVPGGVPLKLWTRGVPAVMHAQRDLVDAVHTLKQVVCVKG